MQFKFETQQEFDDWVETIPEKLKKFKENNSFDFLDESLIITKRCELLANWLITNYKNKEELKKVPEFFEQLAIFLGEMIREALDSKWVIDFDEDKFAYQYSPCIDLEMDGDWYPPFSRLTSTIFNRRTTSICPPFVIEPLKAKGVEV